MVIDYFLAIRAFLQSAELGSFSKAAERIEVKTSTVSRYISELEADLGVSLFNRSTRGLTLTEGGRVFRERALRVMQSLDEAREAASSLNSAPQGVLRVTMPTSFGRRHVIRHLPEFMARYPKINVDAILTDEIVNIIEAGIDVAVRIGVLPDSQLMAKQLATHRRIVCASPEYLSRRGHPATPAELASHEAIRFPLTAEDKWVIVSPSGRSSSGEVTVKLGGRLRVDDTEAVLSLALAGMGVALLPEWAAGGALREGKLVRLLPGWEARTSTATPGVWGVYPPRKTVSPKVRAFLDFFAGLYAREGYWQEPSA